MTMITKQFANDVGNNLFKKFFMSDGKEYSWDWPSIYTEENTDQLTVDTISYAGLTGAVATGELVNYSVEGLKELGKISITQTKYTKGSQLSEELVKSDRYIKFVPQLGKAVGRSLRYTADLQAAAFLNHAFNTAYHVDPVASSGVALCQSHTLKSGDTVLNELTQASLDFDTFWAAVTHGMVNLKTQSGMPITAEPIALIYHPNNEPMVQKIWNATAEPDGSIANPNTLKTYLSGVKRIPCLHLTTNTNWFVLYRGAKDDILREWFWKEQHRSFPAEGNMGLNIFGFQMFGDGVVDFIHIAGNQG